MAQKPVVARVRRPVRPAIQEHESTIEVTSSSYGAKEEDRRVLDVHQFQTEPAFVRISHGATRKLEQDFEFLRVDVAITVPCYKEEVNEVALRVSDEVARILGSELDSYGVPL